jgi:hypothetical protein
MMTAVVRETETRDGNKRRKQETEAEAEADTQETQPAGTQLLLKQVARVLRAKKGDTSSFPRNFN